jgi:hypothetical protein
MSETQVGVNSDPAAAASGALDLVTRATREGAADARAAADRTLAATSRFLSRFVYTTCYTVSYGVVFPTMLLARSIPRDNAAVRGLTDGARAAILEVDRLRGSASESPAEAKRLVLTPG